MCFRPVSLLSVVSKVQERFFAKRPVPHVSVVLHGSQHGFKEEKLCVTQLLEAFHSLDIGTEADIVYSFLFLAFGSVSSFCYIFLVLCVFIKPFGVLGDGVVFVTVFFY